MTLVLLIITFVLQFLLGTGILRLAGLPKSRIQGISLAVLTGFGASTFVLFIMACTNVPITPVYWMAFLILATAGVNIAFRKKGLLPESWINRPLVITGYELVVILSFGLILVMALWRSYYYPVTTRDAIVGMDLVAKWAVKDHTLVSGVFTSPHLNGQLSNQPFYAPFTTLMQIIYLMTGLAFGKLWVGLMTVAFFAYLYARLRLSCHPVLAGALIIFLMCMPGMHPYFYLMLTDWPNAIFFCIGAILWYDAQKTQNGSGYILAGIMLAMACWARAETLFFVTAGILTFPWITKTEHRLKGIGWIWLPSVISFLLWNVLFVYGYLPVQPEMPLGSTGNIVDAGISLISQVVFNPIHFAYAPHVFLLLIALEWIMHPRTAAWNGLLWIPILLIGYMIIVAMIPAATIENTVKRGLFKLFPLVAFYLAESQLFAGLSKRLKQWG
ncbi:MAG: hypothetical protein KDD36_07765 [Flavobacteriales bacterium]|nr:hypothetical protein [Flavobacteriales bacterium]